MKTNTIWQKYKTATLKDMFNTYCNRILIYGGDMPTTAIGFTKAANASNLLTSFTTVSTTFVISNTAYDRVYIGTLPAASVPTQTGTATWACITNSANDTYAFVCDVTDFNGTGVIMLASTDIVQSVSCELYSFCLTLKQG